jgi:Na+/H+ antiporter NhaD/arsenite permease-like protein
LFLFFPVSEFTKTILTSAVGLLTLVGIMMRPFRWNEAVIAMAGAGVLLVLGLIKPSDALSTLVRDWNTFLFFLGMMGISALAEAAGLFDWLAVQAARFAGKSAARLFLNVFLLGTLISMILSNDATALILTPVVYVLVTKLRLPVLPFLFACTFIADTASFLLPISNPINIILLLIGALLWKRTTLLQTGKRISWSTFGFIAGMFIVVQSIEDTGLTTMFGNWLRQLSGGTSFGAVMVGTAGAALGTNLINNVPMAVVMTSALSSIQHAPPAIQHGFIAATMFGCDLGPNLTTVGSLATVLWLVILRQRNIDVSGLDYFKVGVVVTPIMLLAGALTMWLLL